MTIRRSTTLMIGAVILLTAVAGWAQDSGALFVTSDPSGMDVYVDGKLVGSSPITVQKLAPGAYRVEIRSDNYVDAIQEDVEVSARGLTPLSFSLTPATGALSLSSDLGGLTILLDGEPAGDVTPGAPFTQAALSIGAHRLELVGNWFSITRQFAVIKGQTTQISIPAAQHVGSVEVTSDIPVVGARLDGRPLEGGSPYTVPNVSIGEHELVLEIAPVPYREIIEVRPDKMTQLDLRGGEHLGEIVVSADVVAQQIRVRIDGVLVGDTVPTKLQGVVAGAHIIEVSGFRAADGIDIVGQKLTVVQPGGTAVVAFAEDELLTDRPECAEDMVWVPRGPTEGEFVFSMPMDEGTPQSIASDGSWSWHADRSWNAAAVDRYGRRSAYEFSVGGTTYSLQSAASLRATHDSPSSEARPVNADSPLLVGPGGGSGAEGGMMGGPGGGGPGMMGGPGGGPGGGMMGGPSGGSGGAMMGGPSGGSGGAMMGGPGGGSGGGVMGPGGYGGGMMGGAGGGMMGGADGGGAGSAPVGVSAYDYTEEGKGKRKPRPLEGSFENYILRYGTHTGAHFCIDKYEYPNFPGVEPIMATYTKAEQICGQQGKRLCTSTEWVRTCSGSQMQLFPYGDRYDPSKCNTVDNERGGSVAKSGEFSECVSQYGVYDMSGNLAEWVVADPTFGSLGTTPEMGESLKSGALLYDTSNYNPNTGARSSSPQFDSRGGSWLARGLDAACGTFALRGVEDTVQSSATGGGARGFRCCSFAEFDAEVESMITRRHVD